MYYKCTTLRHIEVESIHVSPPTCALIVHLLYTCCNSIISLYIYIYILHFHHTLLMRHNQSIFRFLFFLKQVLIQALIGSTISKKWDKSIAYEIIYLASTRVILYTKFYPSLMLMWHLQQTLGFFFFF
jgi:hypothetical protein